MQRLGNRLWALLPSIVIGAFAVLLLHEWWLIGYVGDPQIIASYHFGSEAMVGNGGPPYKSAEVYAESALWEAGIMTMVALLFLAAGWLRSRQLLGIAYLVLLVGFGAIHYVRSAL